MSTLEIREGQNRFAKIYWRLWEQYLREQSQHLNHYFLKIHIGVSVWDKFCLAIIMLTGIDGMSIKKVNA